MSLYGALFGGVSGLRAQSSKIGIISDNIANTNTIGYKRGSAIFQSLVINSSNEGSYQTGGVRGGTQLNISRQGLLQSTNSATDIAISGGGFFVVRNAAVAISGDTSSTPFYTRAGSFTQDSLGNFVNTSGYFLQGWPLDREGRLPGEPGNLNTTSFTNFDSLETVNVESASGVAQSTSSISLGANLKSSETIFPGSAGVLTPDTTDLVNRNLAADAITVGAEYGLATSNDMRRGDNFNVTINGATTFAFEYGGYAVGRDIASGEAGDGQIDNGADIQQQANLSIVYRNTNDFDIVIPNHGLLTGEDLTISGVTLANAGGVTPAAQLNTTHTVTRIDADTVRITVATAHTQADGTSPVGTNLISYDNRIFSSNVFNANSPSANFLSGLTGYTDDSRSFTITSNSVGTRTFTYTSSAPNAQNGEFSSLSSLATAINAVNGLSARVVDGRLIVASDDSNELVQFANGDAAGSATERGLDWIRELDLKNIEQGNNSRFHSLASLAELVNGEAGISAEVANPLSNASLTIRVDSPLETIQFDDLAAPISITTVGTPITLTTGTYQAGAMITIRLDVGALPAGFGIADNGFVSISGLDLSAAGLPSGIPNGQYEVTATGATWFEVQVAAPVTLAITSATAAAAAGNRVSANGTSNQGSVLSAFGIEPTLNGADYQTYVGINGIPTTGVIDPRYNPTGTNGQNMASGDITAQFSRNVRVYDALGSGHDVRFSFIKVGTNTWAVELHVIPETDIIPQAGFFDGQIATGNIVFNGDGTLQSVSTELQGEIEIAWANSALDSAITLDMGTAGSAFGTIGATVIGLADGMSQFDSGYNVNFANQNGAPVGQLVSVSIDGEGTIVASYSNGQIQALYQLPLADFANPDGMVARSGNVYEQTRDSGEVNLREAGTNGTGTIVSAALEQSNVDLAEELTDMIVAQRAYQANTRVIRTTDELLESLNQI